MPKTPTTTAQATAAWLSPWIWGGGLVVFGLSYVITQWLQHATLTRGMVLIPGGEFIMGSTIQGNEQPEHKVAVRGFYLDEHEVTNAEFAKFVAATGYVTVAEKAPDWEEMKKTLPPGTPEPDKSVMVPGSLVFSPPTGPVPLEDVRNWWRWQPGANWRHPTGPNSNLDGLDQHPVVHVAWPDAAAYAAWAGKRLPTEAEWEYAARGGLAQKRFTWGDEEPTDQTANRGNIWQGDFPHKNTKIDGYDRTAPVKSYPPNGYGLYDMGGNVWEWCGDWYRADAYLLRAGGGVIDNPTGPVDFWDPAEPQVPKRVMRGGSFLCHVIYCESYRPAARRGTDINTSMSHVGFRCARDAP
ncbi:MAG: formylglycine-generating enzyme family protein [Pirellulales bacterium]|nr:formylglycine-generating enzyme family protein [Pirellulales bacterium]